MVVKSHNVFENLKLEKNYNAKKSSIVNYKALTYKNMKKILVAFNYCFIQSYNYVLV